MPISPTPRSLQPEDLRLVACPACRGPLALTAGHILCTVCGRSYPIVDGIPALLPERAS